MGINLNINTIVTEGGSLSGGGAPTVTMYYFPMIGQSQLGGYNASSALSTTPNSNVKTLTNGPIDVNTAGNLIDCVEGDTFSDTGGPAATPDIETIATSCMQQLRLWAGSNVNHRFTTTIHATGGTTLQQLSKGTTRYNELIAAVARMKALADANSWAFQVHPILFHGGTGDNVTTTYKAKVLQLYTDLLADTAIYTTQSNFYLFTHQQRLIAVGSRNPVSSADYGQQQYEAMLTNSNIIVVSPEYKTIYQGDGIHLTNHGERYMAMVWARAIYKRLFDTGFRPLELDSANITYSAGKLIIPVLNSVGTLVKTTSAGLEVFSTTTSALIAGTVAINGTNLEFTPTTAPLGVHALELRTNVVANGELRDSSGTSGGLTTTFLDGSSIAYDLNKYLVRAIYTKSIAFPINVLLNFGGVGADPVVAGTKSVWDTTKSTSDEEYIVEGNFKVYAVNTVSNYWGFTAVTDVKAGTQVVTSVGGPNYYANGVLDCYWFLESKSAGIRLRVNPNSTYTVRCAGCRSGTAGNRQTSYTIGATTIVKVSNRAGTDTIYTTDAENAVFTGIVADSNGDIVITITFAGSDGTNFGYLNAIQITEN